MKSQADFLNLTYELWHQAARVTKNVHQDNKLEHNTLIKINKAMPCTFGLCMYHEKMHGA